MGNGVEGKEEIIFPRCSINLLAVDSTKKSKSMIAVILGVSYHIFGIQAFVSSLLRDFFLTLRPFVNLNGLSPSMSIYITPRA